MGPRIAVSHYSYKIASQLHIYFPMRHDVSIEYFLALDTCILILSFSFPLDLF